MNKKIKRCCVPENRNYVAVLSSELDRLESVLPCGHPASLAINSAETGELLYCELCDDKSARRDAEQRERELQAERDALRAKVAALENERGIDAYVDEYELRGDEGDYTPNSREKLLIRDAMRGWPAFASDYAEPDAALGKEQS